MFYWFTMIFFRGFRNAKREFWKQNCSGNVASSPLHLYQFWRSRWCSLGKISNDILKSSRAVRSRKTSNHRLDLLLWWLGSKVQIFKNGDESYGRIRKKNTRKDNCLHCLIPPKWVFEGCPGHRSVHCEWWKFFSQTVIFCHAFNTSTTCHLQPICGVHSATQPWTIITRHHLQNHLPHHTSRC